MTITHTRITKLVRSDASHFHILHFITFCGNGYRMRLPPSNGRHTEGITVETGTTTNPSKTDFTRHTRHLSVSTRSLRIDKAAWPSSRLLFEHRQHLEHTFSLFLLASSITRLRLCPPTTFAPLPSSPYRCRTFPV